MPEPIKAYKLSDTEVEKQMQFAWRIPTTWLLSQIVNCYMEEKKEIIFAEIEGKLFMKGIRQTNEEGQVLPAETWFEEFPPWP
ncbi:MAG TPA: hypothetical protein VMX58_12480 [Patescibacteria group bacterium]|nr:hypothetical protein [Patescibacteria group bacterium]